MQAQGLGLSKAYCGSHKYPLVKVIFKVKVRVGVSERVRVQVRVRVNVRLGYGGVSTGAIHCVALR